MTSHGGASGNRKVMHTLVVCGAMRHNVQSDGAMFSDFMGITMTFRGLLNSEVEGTFMSCFPLKEHFEWLGNRSPSIADIKWGERSNGKAIYTYSRDKFQSGRGLWYDYHSPKDLDTEVKTWIWKKTKEAQPGDVINMFFQCHGSKDGVHIGSKLLRNSEMVSMLRLFSPGVQVNAVGSHCYSGQLVSAIRADNQRSRYIVAAAGENEVHWASTRSFSNRIRNFRFSQPFVQSLARVKLPGVAQEESAPITIAEHNQFMREAMRKITPNSPAQTTSTYNTYLSPEKKEALEFLENLILRDYADVVFQKENVSRRRRIEWPSIEGTLNNIFGHRPTPTGVPAPLDNAVKALVTAECAACDPKNPHYHDFSVLDNLLNMQVPDWKLGLQVLYWRGRRMSAVWDIFMVLCDRGFLEFESLINPMCFNPRSITQDVHAVMKVLICFEYARPEYLINTLEFDDQWDVALLWLATVIVRSCIEPAAMFETLEYTGILGKMDLNALRQFQGQTSFHHDRLSMIGEEKPHYGFWLPHGIGNCRDTWADTFRTSIERFNNVEHIFKEYFRIPDSQLITEDMQDRYYRKNPLFEPGYQHSGLRMAQA